MKKDEFLKALEVKLDILEDVEKKKLISSYRTKINKRVKSGEKEVDVIDSFGDIDLLVANILRGKGIKPNGSNKTDSFFGGFIRLIEDIATYISKKDLKDIFKMILELFLIILIVAVMKVPFILIQQIIEGLFDIFGNMGSVINRVIEYCFDLIYIIVAIFMFIALFKKRFEKYRSEK